MAEELDADQPVEVVIRGDAMAVIGALEAAVTAARDDDSIRGRPMLPLEDLSSQLGREVNMGYLQREMKRLVNKEDPFEYRGIQVIAGEFDAQHPRPHGQTSVDRLTDLEEMETYVILGRSEAGFEAAGYPDGIGVEDSMMMASFMRQYARDLEAAVARPDMEPEDLRPDEE